MKKYLEAQKSRNYIYLKEASARQRYRFERKKEDLSGVGGSPRVLIPKNIRSVIFQVVEEDNKVYQELLESLSCDHLETYRQSAKNRRKQLWSTSRMTSFSRSAVRSSRPTREEMS